MQRNDLLVWMDLEMTSLTDARVDKIVEIAVVLTDSSLEVVAEGPSIVIHAEDELFDRINEEYKQARDESGIRADSVASSVNTEEAEEAVLSFLREHVTPQSSPLCGNSIHMDRHFLRLQMPKLDAYLHYRCIDVSTIKELAKRWDPDLYETAAKQKLVQTHRAKDDILQSIDELRLYRDQLFGSSSISTHGKSS